jgi:serine/threonine protein kinase
MAPGAPGLERIPLSRGFRFLHEPLGTSNDVSWIRFVGRDAELDDLVSRIVLSNGGAFLLTGYRGVGKTTFVNRVIHEVRERLPRAEGDAAQARVVDVAFNFARPMEPVELLYHTVRGLHRRLVELDILRHLDPGLRQDLELAVTRTSATVAVGSEAESVREIGTGEGPIGGFAIPLPLALKRAWKDVRRRDLTYAAYEEKSAEHDLISIAQRLSRGYVESPPRRFAWRARPPGQRVPLKVVMVFDELDKLDDDRSAGDRSPLDRILGTLKNLFTTSGLTFVFVAGKGLHERWLEDLSRGDSVFESVFAHAQYLSGMWSDTDALCDSLVVAGERTLATNTPSYVAFKRYLAYKGRGIPRRTIRGFNEFVRWNGSTPQLEFEPSDVRRFRFYAGLLEALEAAEDELLGRYRGEGSVEQVDKRRLGLYYATDWIVQRQQQEFTLDDLVAASRRMSRLITPVEEAAPAELQRLLDVLLRGHYIEPAASAPGTLVAGVRVGVQAARYRLPRRRLLELGAFLGVFEQEAQALFKTSDPPVPPSGSTSVPLPSWSVRYDVIAPIGRGAMSTVYLARDKQAGRQVALKELSRSLVDNPALRRRATAEGEVLRTLDHPGVVRVFDVWTRDDAVAMAMEYLEGMPLTDLLRHGPVSDVGIAGRLMGDLADAVAYIHHRNVVWRDPKPGNVFVTREGRVVIFDFGIARQLAGASGDTETGAVLGTPGYMSPEQIRGEPVDSRSDMFGLGALFFELLTGRRPYPGSTFVEFAGELLSAAAVPPPSSITAAAVVFDDVVARCLALVPDQRATAEELRDEALRHASPRPAIAAYVEGLRSQRVDREELHTVFESAAPPPPAVPDTGVPQPSVPLTAYPEAAATPVTVPTPVPAYGWRDVTRLEVIGGDQWVSLSGRTTRIGRSVDNDLVLDAMSVSRYAAVVTRGDTIFAASGEHSYYVEDLNSTNGILLNGEPVTRMSQLHDGDELAIGSVRLRFRQPAHPASRS